VQGSDPNRGRQAPQLTVRHVEEVVQLGLGQAQDLQRQAKVKEREPTMITQNDADFLATQW
jgi:hypothetical protein